MKRLQKISAYILFLPVFSILVHNLVPHHHHESCISETHEIVGETEHHHAQHTALTESHQHACDIPDHGLNVHKHQTDNDQHCHLSDIYKVEKQYVDINCFETFIIKHTHSEQELVYPSDFTSEYKPPNALLFFNRGPPIV
jgi:hypothetical protein